MQRFGSFFLLQEANEMVVSLEPLRYEVISANPMVSWISLVISVDYRKNELVNVRQGAFRSRLIGIEVCLLNEAPRFSYGVMSPSES